MTAIPALTCDNESGPDGATNTRRDLTRLLDLSERGLAVKATRVCSVDDCDRPAKGKREWCAMHTERWRRWGDPTEMHPRLRSACSVDGCDRLSDARGWCQQHYRYWRQNGDPLDSTPKPRPKKAEIQRLLDQLDRSGGPDACWPWSGHRGPRGYGHTYLERNGKRVSMGAHRAVYQAVHGDLPADLFVLHSCHNPPCCNPAHLRSGTHLENMADRQQEGAGYPKGNDSPVAVQIAPEIVAAIRAAYAPRVKGRGQHALAQQFGLSRTTVQRIVTQSDRWAESA